MTSNVSKSLIFQSNEIEDEKKYWLNKLSGELIKTHFPYDNIRKDIPENKRNEIAFIIPEELYAKLSILTNQSEMNLYVVLLTCLIILLNKYTGHEDIIIAAPIYKQDADGEFINTVVTIRSQLTGQETLKELIINIKETLFEANENLNYPIERLLYHLDLPSYDGDFPLFETAILLENIHHRKYIENVKLNMIFSFMQAEECIKGVLEYNSFLYKNGTIERIIMHFIFLLQEIVKNIKNGVADIELVSREEKEQVLLVFNDTEKEFPGNKTICELFEEQVEKRPDCIAVAGANPAPILSAGRAYLTYDELNKKANQLARIIRAKGVKSDTAVGIMLEPSIEMVVGIFAVLKARGAYLPIDIGFPVKRINYMSKDSKANIILTRQCFMDKTTNGFEMINIEDKTIYTGKNNNLDILYAPADIIYMIYTSGTSGNPKGVLIKNENLVNYITWIFRETALTKKDKTILLSSFAFDLCYTSLFSSVLIGGELHLSTKDSYLSPEILLNYIKDNKITYLKITPSFFSLIINNPYFSREICASLRLIILGGEPINTKDVEKTLQVCEHLRVMNHYGPTEATIGSVAQYVDFDRFEDYKRNPTIGRPIDNTKIYILDKDLKSVPVGVPSELCIGGKAPGRGYLNRPEITADKFIINPFMGDNWLYRTGDLARWTPDGLIEFLGRIDQQVKIRGYRIELGEIEKRLLCHDLIKEAVVAVRGKKKSNGNSGSCADKFLCAYIVSVTSDLPVTNEALVSELRTYLAAELPDYMVPYHFILMECIPITSNGKVDLRKLPEPQINTAEEGFVAARDRIEKKLEEIWSSVLEFNGDNIGIDANFYEMGGHSLNTITLTLKVHKELNVKIPINEVFKLQTIREMADYIRSAEEELFVSIQPVEKREYYPVSAAQRRMFILNQMKNQDISDNTPEAFTVEGDLDKERFEQAIKLLIKRHDTLRTSFRVINGNPMQFVHEDVDFKVKYLNIEENEIADVIKASITPFDLSKAPLLKAVLLKKPDGQHVFLFDMHHIIRDAVSTNMFIKDFFCLYENRELPGLRIQYNDFAIWQDKLFNSGAIKKQEEYWLGVFSGKIPVLNLPTDYPRPPVQTFAGDDIAFEFDLELSRKIRDMALQKDATTYILLLAIYNVLLSKYSFSEDIVVGMPTAGRAHSDLDGVIGFFVNTLAIRNYPAGEKTFLEFFEEVKSNSFAAYHNQDYQFDELVNKLNLKRDPSRNPLFDTMFAFHNTYTYRNLQIPEGETADLSYKNFNFSGKVAQFDIMLHAMEIRNVKIVFNLLYNTDLFKRETIEKFIQHFTNVAEDAVDNPNKIIKNINILSENEKEELSFESSKKKIENLEIHFDF